MALTIRSTQIFPFCGEERWWVVRRAGWRLAGGWKVWTRERRCLHPQSGPVLRPATSVPATSMGILVLTLATAVTATLDLLKQEGWSLPLTNTQTFATH